MNEQSVESQLTFEEMEHRAHQAIRQRIDLFTKVLSVSLDVLSRRIYIFAALAITAAMFFWAMSDANLSRISLATIFSLFVLALSWSQRNAWK